MVAVCASGILFSFCGSTAAYSIAVEGCAMYLFWFLRERRLYVFVWSREASLSVEWVDVMYKPLRWGHIVQKKPLALRIILIRFQGHPQFLSVLVWSVSGRSERWSCKKDENSWHTYRFVNLIQELSAICMLILILVVDIMHRRWYQLAFAVGLGIVRRTRE